MASATGSEGNIKPIDLASLSQPLDFIRADHARQRALCGVIEDLARASSLENHKAERVVEQLGRDLALHVIDEEEDLFPLLRRRCRPEDDIDAVLTLLSGEHSGQESVAKEIRDALSGLMASGAPVRDHPGLQEKMLRFTARERRHLELENSIVIPIARARLNERDLSEISRGMAARRGVRLPNEDSP